MSNNKSNSNSNNISKKKPVENVLILQGGGSLGAFACGVFKTLIKKDIKFDIVGGTSIGGVNGAIIAGSKNENPVKDLENFWIELAESSYNFFPDIVTLDFTDTTKGIGLKTVPSAALNSTIFGIPKMFVPRWFQTRNISDQSFFDNQQLPWNWTFIYDNSPLSKTLEKYIDFNKLSPAMKYSNNTKKIRLIVTAVNVLNSEPLIFDSFERQIQLKHILASIGYPNYGFSWVEVEEGVYGWDGALLSNTPMREVIVQTPSNDKNIYIIENYSRKINELPSDMTEVQARIKDILYGDKSKTLKKISKIITRQLELIENMYPELDFTKIDSKKSEYIKKEYEQLVNKYGAKILNITRISRDTIDSPYPLQNADFSIKTVKSLIKEGETKAMEILE